MLRHRRRRVIFASYFQILIPDTENGFFVIGEGLPSEAKLSPQILEVDAKGLRESRPEPSVLRHLLFSRLNQPKGFASCPARLLGVSEPPSFPMFQCSWVGKRTSIDR